MALRQLASKYDVERVPPNAGRKRVEDMFKALVQVVAADGDDGERLRAAYDAYQLTWPQPGGAVEEEAVPAHANESSEGTDWYFHAAQLTYNSKSGEWASTNLTELENLFSRLVVFAKSLSKLMDTKGTSCTLEGSTLEGIHCHAHIYFHLGKPFHRSTASPFRRHPCAASA